jgi:acyl-CoA synthetase (NDP forming)
LLLNEEFSKAFNPASIAIVGVSSSTAASAAVVNTGGLPTVRNLLALGFEGHIYPINPNVSQIMGLKTYPSIAALPEKVDLVIVAVQARSVPDVLRDCVKANALNVHVMTSGFGETQQEEGIKLQEEVRQIALKAGLRLIGPNCMGLHVPSAKMSNYSFYPQESGAVAFVSQSGSVAGDLMVMAEASGIKFSKIISCGNSLILDIADYAEFLSTDPETQVIGMYVEGVRDGKRLLEIVRRTNPVKPVVIWKVGLSGASARAALSHSGMLGGERRAWDAFFKQTGAVMVRSIEELSDMLMTFTYMKPPRGKAAAVLTAGGGTTVAAGETCTEGGIYPPALSPESRDKLIKTISLVNQGISNPLDIPYLLNSPDLLREILIILADDPAVDFLLINWPSFGFNNPDLVNNFTACVGEFAKSNRNNKPVAFSINSRSFSSSFTIEMELLKHLPQAGVPVYHSLARASRAISHFVDYHNYVTRPA